MKTLTKILVPVDFSPHSKEALRTAAELSERYDAGVLIVHTFEPVAFALPEGYMILTANQLANVTTEIDQRLSALKQQAEAAGARRVETAQLMGIAASSIVDCANERKADLIVMGTHGRTGLGHVLLGSVAERVLRKAPCPVLVVRAPESTSEAEKA